MAFLLNSADCIHNTEILVGGFLTFNLCVFNLVITFYNLAPVNALSFRGRFLFQKLKFTLIHIPVKNRKDVREATLIISL